MRSFQESRLLLTAVELDVFTAVKGGAAASEVALDLNLDPRATETLLNALAGIGALIKQNGNFCNTPETARYLVRGSADDARPALLHTVNMWDAWSSLTQVVRSGGPVDQVQPACRDMEWIHSFIAAMHRNAEAVTPEVVRMVGAQGVRRMLDVGGGSGAFAIAFAKTNPALHAEVFDLASVVPIAQQNIAAAGLSDRVATRIGDLRKDGFGGPYDLILLSAICHMLSPAENGDLLRRCHEALTSPGRLVIRDFILDPDKTSPKAAALFSVHMLVNTTGGSNYSELEYRQWLAAAGFPEVQRPIRGGDLMVATV
jgi:2-polyprenyl-3-methyl-5-hydroxy-6-metoxy-1,4-benzoquinol methylase